jgi:hypothetical protein
MNSPDLPNLNCLFRLRRGDPVNLDEEQKMERVCKSAAGMEKLGALDDSVETAVKTAFLIEKKVQAKIQDGD